MSGGRPKKTQYRRSTPVIRLQRNVAKLERNADLVLTRLSSWLVDGDETLVLAVGHTDAIMRSIEELKAEIEGLAKVGFTPPKRSASMVFVEGQKVAIAPKHRERYEQAFKRLLEEDLNFLDGLVVTSILESGEITVQRGKRTPFIVRKSHIVPVY